MKRILPFFLCLMLLFGGCSASVETSFPRETATQSVPAAPVKPSAVTPTRTQEPAPGAYDYTYKPYVISELYENSFSKEEVETAREIIDAYLAYKSSAPCTDELTETNAFVIASQCFPPFYAFTKRNELHPYREGKVTWELKQSEDEHKTMLKDYEAKITEYMTVLRENDAETARALALYRELLTGSKYDSSFDGKTLDETPLELTSYYFLLNRSGVCHGYATAYAYLLAQVGINAAVVMGTDRKMIEDEVGTPHMWVMLEIDGHYYFADPTWETSATELTYFGITVDWRSSENGGAFPQENMFICGCKHLTEYNISDDRFSEFHTDFGAALVKDWHFNAKRSMIIYTTPDKDEKTFSLV